MLLAKLHFCRTIGISSCSFQQKSSRKKKTKIMHDFKHKSFIQFSKFWRFACYITVIQGPCPLKIVAKSQSRSQFIPGWVTMLLYFVDDPANAIYNVHVCIFCVWAASYNKTTPHSKPDLWSPLLNPVIGLYSVLRFPNDTQYKDFKICIVW